MFASQIDPSSSYLFYIYENYFRHENIEEMNVPFLTIRVPRTVRVEIRVYLQDIRHSLEYIYRRHQSKLELVFQNIQ